jgi:hypothetical protein
MQSGGDHRVVQPEDIFVGSSNRVNGGENLARGRNSNNGAVIARIEAIARRIESERQGEFVVVRNNRVGSRNVKLQLCFGDTGREV